jgi:hypothetical protein
VTLARLPRGAVLWPREAGRRQIGESWLIAEEFSANTAVKPLNLAGGGRASRLGQQAVDAVLAADRIKEHLHSGMVEPAGEHLAVIGQDLLESNSQ